MATGPREVPMGYHGWLVLLYSDANNACPLTAFHRGRLGDLHDHRKLEVSMRDPEWILQRGMSHGHWAKRGTNGISWLARVALQ